MKKSRVKINSPTVSAVLIKSHYRCAICPQHRRVADIHHIDGDPSNNLEENLVGVCKECHADIHEISTMRRKFAHGDLSVMKLNWEKTCLDISSMMGNTIVPHQWIYANLHRLGPLYKQITGRHLLSVLPFRFRSDGRCLNTLWHNRRSSLGFMEHVELRECLNSCIEEVITKIDAVNLNLLEIGALDPKSLIGNYVYFSAHFKGKDIARPDEFLENDGDIVGPPGTLRREVINDEDPSDMHFIETCLSIEPRYYYSDSAFIQLCETGNWCGLGLFNAVRHPGSNDGPHRRTQLIVSPLCIASTARPLSRVRDGESIHDEYMHLELNLHADD